MSIVFSLGSNLGDRLANLQSGVDLVGAALPGVRASPVYETAPVGGPPQPDYLNAVLVAPERPVDLLALVTAAETRAARVRAARWGPRTLDLDVVAAGPRISHDPMLRLPHPLAHQRGFVLIPWLDLEPEAVLPGHGRVADLVVLLHSGGVHRRPELELRVPG